jgi:RimJ/RimL family protein N-acetyltransferase
VGAVISLIHPDNTRSLALAKRLGEQFERTIDFFGDEVGVYGIDKASWEAAGVA